LKIILKNEADFEEQRQRSFTIEKHLEELNEQISAEQKNLDKERNNLDSYNKALEKFRLDEAKKEEQIKTNEANLKILEWKNYAEKSVQEVEEIFHKLSESNRETEQNYLQLIKEEKEISPKLAEQKTIVNQLEKRISELEQEIAGNTLLIETALSEQQFDQHKVLEILAEKIDVEEAKNLIQEFKIKFQTLKNSITELEQKLKDFAFDQEEFSAVESRFATLEAEVKTANDTVVKIKSEIERL
jgi:exonuclease SbcC